MSVTADFFAALCREGGTDDRPFVDARQLASGLSMNDADLVATLETLEFGNLIEEFDRTDAIAVRLTERGVRQCRGDQRSR